MKFDDPKERREFRKKLSDLGLSEVQYRLGAKKFGERTEAVVRQWITDFESGALIEDDLLNIIDELEFLNTQFIKDSMGNFLGSENQAYFERLFLEAKTLIGEHLGRPNDYSNSLMNSYNEGVGGFMGGPSQVCIMQVIEIVRGAIKQMQRKKINPEIKAPQIGTYIDVSRLEEIGSISSGEWDFSRLIQMCKELNTAHQNRNYISVAMLIRGIIDHIPPVFGKETFNEVANNHSGQSFCKSMKKLHESMRNVSDMYLHQQIRSKESLPTENQTDVKIELDTLIAEVIRLAKS